MEKSAMFVLIVLPLTGFVLGILIGGASNLIPRLYQTIEPLLAEIIELKKKRLRDRYNDEQAANKTARGE